MIEFPGPPQGATALPPEPLETDSKPSVVDVTDTKRRRRPTGGSVPLPKKIGLTGKLWITAVLLVAVSGCIWLHSDLAPLERLDAPVTRMLESLRTGWLDALARGVNSSASSLLAVLGLVTVGLAIFFRRFRHLIVFLASLALLKVLAEGLSYLAQRPRPFGVLPVAPWEGYSAPSLPIAALVTTLMGIAYMLVVPGRPRFLAKLLIAGAAIVAGLVRIYLGIDHMTDGVFAALIGVAIPVALFRAFVPNEVFPVVYGKRGKSAHLDVSGRRGEAIRQAVRDQLGMEILSMKLVGLEGSGGSTPLKLRVIGDDRVERSVFAKLYAKNHVRADRWYKLGRTMLYGRLEDETPFKTVRRFVEYEDYALRLLDDYRFPIPTPLGIAEITPESEFLIAMEFFEDAVEIGEAEVDDQIIDEGLRMIRRMWDVGISHRDIKPANLMVQQGHLKLIDVFFVQVRPSPWRQAVDLANMMLVLALRSDAQRVYDAALRYFTADELSEAFAAARSVASPTQLRMMMKQDSRDLLEEFRSLAPARRSIAIQRWNLPRVALIIGALAAVGIAIGFGVSLFFPTRGNVLPPGCESDDRTTVTMAQALPSAERTPCIESVPLGWEVTQTTVVRGRASFILSSTPESGGPFSVQVGRPIVPLVEVVLTPTCPPSSLRPGEQTLPVEGGCVTYYSSLPAGTPSVPSFDEGGGLSWVDRSAIVASLGGDDVLRLCGPGIDCVDT
jgi:tRNA A-37 threonylcarbamoyl transferase component Bud32/membrane-associated phospholipid phosphatase